MNCFHLLRTNVGLTTNIKVVVTSNYELFLDSIKSNPELSDSKYNAIRFNKDNYYDDLIPHFYKNTPEDIAFYIKYDDDVSIMYDDFMHQFDDTYITGARNISENKNYKEEFEYFAPVYFERGCFPKYFVIFRVDGPGLLDLNKDNFKSEIINNLKCVKLFDLTPKTNIGYWIEKNFIKNENFPIAPLEFNFKKDEFTKWYGIDYESGGYVYKSKFINDLLERENLIYDLEKFIFDGYKNNKVVFPNILNLSFLFDDVPATKTSIRKWSINRYYGFYLNDLELIHVISPFKPKKIKDGFIINENNIIVNQNNNEDDYPFDDNKTHEDFKDGEYFIEYYGNFYKIIQYTENTQPQTTPINVDNNTFIEEEYVHKKYVYKIISDINLYNQQNNINKNICYIDSDNFIRNLYDDTYFNAEYFNDDADVWLIEIDGKYHNLMHIVNNSDVLVKLNTDYGFTFSNDEFTYYINDPDPNYKWRVKYKDENGYPITFKIYRLNFSDIKDFDTCIIDTEYSKYEYEFKDKLTYTDEPKFYLYNRKSKSVPPPIDDYTYNGEIIYIPCSSEYTTNLETFRIINNDLSDIWRKNPVYCRWGYKNSIGFNDYPYLLNISTLFEDFNKNADLNILIPSRENRNLDYFYTINTSTSSYIHHSLHIEDFDTVNKTINENFNFNINYYLNDLSYQYDGDYFTYIFSKKAYFDNGNIEKNTKKYSTFIESDGENTNSTLFKGIKFLLYKVDNIKIDNNKIEKINIKPTNEFKDYKFSIILTRNDDYIPKISMDWLIIDEWDPKQIYETNSIVVHDDILYIANANSGPIIINNNTNDDPFSGPYKHSEWGFYQININNTDIKTWRPDYDSNYPTNSIVYNCGEYYYCVNPSGTVSFWNPTLSYNVGDIVIYKNKYYVSTINNNTHKPPAYNKNSVEINNSTYYSKYWKHLNNIDNTIQPKWKIIELWDRYKQYDQFNDYFVVYNNNVYKCISTIGIIGIEPDNDQYWEYIGSIFPDYNKVYKTGDIIFINGKYHILKDNDGYNKLKSGINIYINKKWKNVLVNISIDDNTLKNYKMCERDFLYSPPPHKFNKTYNWKCLDCGINYILTANNFIQCLNDLNNKHGFANSIKYHIINDNNSIETYDEKNINKLPYILLCEYPDELIIKTNVIEYEINEPEDLLLKNKIKNKTIGGSLNNINEIEYYNDIPLSYNIKIYNEDQNKYKNFYVKNRSNSYKNIKEDSYSVIYRYSGYYTPIFYEIELFERPKLHTKNCGNYKFDTNLTYFGYAKQLIISKVNMNGNILKLKNNKNYKSIYPMIDEFGYTVVDHFIYKSNWDFSFYLCVV